MSFLKALYMCGFRRCVRSGGLTVFFLALVFFAGGAKGVLAQSAPSGPEAVFFSNLEDVPLMPGLTELPSEGVVFDKPEGRIIEAMALTGRLDHKDILVYYGGTLPQLGWGRINQTSFFRDGERLEISFSQGENGEIVRFLVQPVL